MPQNDDRDLKAHIIPKVMAAKDKFDVVFMRPGTYTPPEVGTWGPEDERLPDSQTPYYLKANTGPRWMCGGVMSRPFCTTRQTEGKFAISSIESSKVYPADASPFARPMTFAKTDHSFTVLEGTLGVALGAGEKTLVHDGESVMVPAGEAFSLSFESRYVRVWSFASGDGVEALVHEAGEPYESMVIPDEVSRFDAAKLEAVGEKIGVTFGN